MHNWYYDEGEVRRAVQGGRHRDVIGGLWEELGDKQMAFLMERGLKPQHRLLDLGCGSGRLAVKVVPYLAPGNYVGIDISPSLLGAARTELTGLGVADKLGPEALHATATFEPHADAAPFDFGIAQSLFTHLPLEEFERCLTRVRPWFAAGKLYVTFFVASHAEVGELWHEPGGVTTFAHQDPYHFTIDAIMQTAAACRWSANWIGDWRHPRDQQICEFSPIG